VTEAVEQIAKDVDLAANDDQEVWKDPAIEVEAVKPAEVMNEKTNAIQETVVAPLRKDTTSFLLEQYHHLLLLFDEIILEVHFIRVTQVIQHLQANLREFLQGVKSDRTGTHHRNPSSVQRITC